jgi:hypothetical protein
MFTNQFIVFYMNSYHQGNSEMNILRVVINEYGCGTVMELIHTVQHATIEEAVFSVDPTDGPIDWLDSDHVIYVDCRSMSVPRLCSESCEL